jgi:hypothetical protein
MFRSFLDQQSVTAQAVQIFIIGCVEASVNSVNTNIREIRKFAVCEVPTKNIYFILYFIFVLNAV